MSEKQVQGLLTDTAQLLDALLEVVLPDFIRTTQLMKRVTPDASNDEKTRAYACVIQELQYYDTLSQKLSHIKAIHELVRTSFESACAYDGQRRVPGASIIRLNHIQFQVACFEYLSSVNEIETNLEILLAGEPDIGAYAFQHSNLLLSGSRNINKNFETLEKTLQHAFNLDLERNVERINGIYSMEIERNILQVYLNKPMLHDCEIEPLHKSNRKTEIDLF